MDMTMTIILEDNIDNNLWPKFLLAITYVKNNWPIRAFQDLSPYESYIHKPSDLAHLQILGSMVYVFLYKEERTLKSEKWAPRVLNGTLVGYNSHTIYQIYLKDQKKII